MNEVSSSQAGALSHVDMAALEHTARFRLSTPESLARRLFGGDTDAAITCASRLIQAGCLTAHPVGTDLGYFALTPRGAAQQPGSSVPQNGPMHESLVQDGLVQKGLELGERRALTGRELAQAYGTLAFCTDGPALRERVLPSEIVTDCRDVDPLLRLRLDFFVGESGFGACLVDAAGQHPLRLTRKAADVVHRLLACESLNQLQRNDKFVVALVTADPATARAVKGEMRRWRLPLRPLIVTLPPLARFQPVGRS